MDDTPARSNTTQGKHVLKYELYLAFVRTIWAMQLSEASVDNTLLNLHNSSDGSCSSYLEEKSPMVRFPDPKIYRGVARGVLGSPWGLGVPLVGLLFSKQPTIFSWQKRHYNILAVKDAIVEKPTF